MESRFLVFYQVSAQDIQQQQQQKQQRARANKKGKVGFASSSGQSIAIDKGSNSGNAATDARGAIHGQLSEKTAAAFSTTRASDEPSITLFEKGGK
ncbi:hypothetical protein SPI_09363 [Niveomyces insectorum RCEF 264]|uniref:Uncharacterized protein n=1 Tax=Niveomyces insectorum RCEF 264 TaxID=1081102 RepID=A0A167LXT9_9HYPO|nr:hypothetical protein SPI_09363 [Niveomyces insectorum RCEF 264]